jgi:hypothetical protein
MREVHFDIFRLPVSGVPSRHKDWATGTGLHLYTRMVVTRVVDPRHFNADPDLDPAFHLNADLYTTFRFNANTDFALIEVMQRCNHWSTDFPGLHSELPDLQCEHPRLLKAPFCTF